MDGLLLAALAFVSSTLTAVVGVGGGVLLIAVMPGFVPPAALVPLHGVVQLASNASRAAFAVGQIDWRILRLYAAGALVGALLGYRFVPLVPTRSAMLVLGLFVLVTTWLPRPRSGVSLPGTFVTLGVVQTFVSLFVGAAGPLSPPVLLRAGLERDRLVATHAGLMTLLHLLKALVFGMLGFAFAPHAGVLAGMVVGVTAGSWLGTRLRRRVPHERFRQVLRVVLTLLALRLILGLGIG